MLLGCALTSPWAAQAPKPAVFPAITAYRLDKQKIVLPSGLEGQTNLLILSFEEEQKRDADSWMPAAQALQHSNFQFRYYSTPVFVRENFVFRWWETASLRNDQTDPETLHWIVPLFVERGPFLNSLGIANAKQVAVLLVDRQGQVLWRALGAMTEDKRASLMAAAGAH